MKSYTITVNGNVYDVTVEEGTLALQLRQQHRRQLLRQHRRQLRQHRRQQLRQQRAGAVKVTASVPGKVYKVEASVGQAVKKGDSIVILEAMKMEIPVVAPQDGTVASIDVAAGDAVESGDVLATLN